MSLRTLIADDEPIARQLLREELETFADVELVAEAEDGEAALERIVALRPDLAFLDLQMPGLTGMEVVRRLKQGTHLPIVVVVTAYDQYAIQAFEAGAVDYLLKPFSRERLNESLHRARRLKNKPVAIAERVASIQTVAESRPAPAQPPPVRKVVGRLGEEFFLLGANEILAFQADGDLVWIVTAGKRYLATQSLRALEVRLKDATFRRVHRNALVNLNHVRKMTSLTSNRWLLTLTNGMELIVSKRQAGTVRELLAW
jgi:DNA-binding LytR/AlgR family response regulator